MDIDVVASELDRVSGSEIVLDCLNVEVLSELDRVSGSEMLLDWICVS